MMSSFSADGSINEAFPWPETKYPPAQNLIG